MLTFYSYLNETSLSRIKHHSEHSSLAMLTAHRGENTPEQNHKANQSLEHELRSKNYGITHIHGHYVENKGEKNEKKVHEHSFLVVPKKGTNPKEFENHIKSLGQTHKQDSVLIKHPSENAHLHGTNPHGTWIKNNEKLDVGKFHANKPSDYMSKLKNPNKSFTFSEECNLIMDKALLTQDNF